LSSRLSISRSTNRNNLARVLRQLGELPAARALYEQALMSDLKLHGNDHPMLRFTEITLLCCSKTLAS
jgi:hypothetical protein